MELGRPSAGMKRALILSAGDGARWGEYLGVPKQLIPIRREPLLYRTVRLVRENGIVDVRIVTHDPRLRVEHCGVFRPRRYRWTAETLLSTRHLWSARTLVLLGDVFYSDQAMDRIVNWSEPIAIFGRRGPNEYTGCRHGELFAISVDETMAHVLQEAASRAVGHAECGAWGNLWDVYYCLVGLPLDSARTDDRVFQQIQDLTDDFDTPEDYDRAIPRYRALLSGCPLRRWAMLLRIHTASAFRQAVT